MMNNYTAKNAYQNDHNAVQYDKTRFTSIRGKYLDRLEKMSILRCLSTAFSGCSPSSICLLDIPCGTGRITETLLLTGYKVFGADISDEMMEVARKRLQQFSGIKGLYKEDIEQLSFDNSVFDATTCVRLMGHLPMENKKAALRELARVSNKFVIVTFYISNMKNDLKRIVTKKLFNKTAPWHPLTRREVILLVNDCGLNIVKYCDVHKLISEASTYLLKV
ncbi:MAG: hypothetical protein SRB2_04482 [Desulfobacteraceae bacterium Eth-SRB2]|nr:MAG: hypothetical protein SRB2_04482 [Desulfobacteraceae bacterium Eth-SRB2]